MKKLLLIGLLFLLVLTGYFSSGCGLTGQGNALIVTCDSSVITGAVEFGEKRWTYTLSIKNWMSKDITLNSAIAEIVAPNGTFSIPVPLLGDVNVPANTTVLWGFELTSGTSGGQPRFTSGQMTETFYGTMEGGTAANGAIILTLE